MDNKTKSRNLLEDITPEELEKVRNHQSKIGSPYPVDDDWLLLAEIAKTFGWQAMLDAKKDNTSNVTAKEMYTLIAAARKLRSIDIYDAVQAGLTVNQISYAKSPKSKLQAFLSRIKKELKAD